MRNTHFYSFVAVAVILASVLSSLVTLALTRTGVVHADASASVTSVNACVDSQGNLQLLSKGGTCAKGQTPVTLSVGGASTTNAPPFFCNGCNGANVGINDPNTKYSGKDFTYAIINTSRFGLADVFPGISTNFSNDNFTGAQLSQDNFSGDDFSNSIFVDVEMTGDTDTGVNFTNVNFTNSLIGDNMQQANLSHANFTNVTFQNANLQGVINDATANFTGATWQTTTCPDGTNSDNNGNTCIGHL